MKILIPLFGASFHGGTRVLFQIANGLVERGVEVEVICPATKFTPIYHLDRRVQQRLVNIDSLFLYCLYLIFYFLISSKRVVLLSHWLTGLLHFPSIVFRGDGIYLVQDTEEVFYPKPTMKGKILRNFVFLSYKLNSKYIIVTTKYGFNKLKKILKNRAIPNLISLGVDKSVFYYKSKSLVENRILVFPRRGEFKGDVLLYDTLKLLRVDPYFKRFEIIGISQQEELRTKFEGVVDHFIAIENDTLLADYYNTSAFLLHTSHYEGVCLPILESISCGCPVVCTNSFGPAHYLSPKNSQVTSIREEHNLVRLCHDLMEKKLDREAISNSVSHLSISNFLLDVEEFICSKL